MKDKQSTKTQTTKQLIKTKRPSRFKRLLKNKWLKNTSSTLAIVALILAIFIVLNVVINNLKLNPIDFTAQKVYTLSDDSKNEISKI